MNEIHQDGSRYTGYEYLEADPNSKYASLYLDSYPNFGWVPDERIPEASGKRKLVWKRDRKIVNKTELTRLQRHFEACVEELAALERSKTSAASLWAIVIGLTGTAFLSGSTFAVVHEPPLIPLTIVLAVPGFVGWLLPWFVYQKLVRKRTAVVRNLMEQKYDEIDEICQRGNTLLK